MTGRDKLQIGEVAERLGLSLRTIRYYEEAGLVQPSARTDGGFRLYSEGDVERLQVIMHMKPLGFTINQMRELLDACDQLARAPASDASSELALERLADFAAAAKEKTRELHQQLEMAERFSRRLQRELRRHRQSVPAEAGPAT